MAGLLRLMIDSGVMLPAPIQHYQYNIIANSLLSASAFHPFAVSYTIIQWLGSLRWLWIFPALLFVEFLSSMRSNLHRISNLTEALESRWLGTGYSFLMVAFYFILNLAAGDQWRCALYIFPVIYSAIILGFQRGISQQISLPLLLLMIITPQACLGSAMGTLVSLQIVYPMPLVLARTLMGK